MNKFFRNIGVYLIIFALVLTMAYLYKGGAPKEEIKEIKLSEFVNELSEEQVKSINIGEVTSSNVKPIEGELKDGTKFTCYVASITQLSILDQMYILPQVEAGTIESYTSDEPTVTPWYVSMLPTLIIAILMIVFVVMIMNQQGGGKAMQFGKSRARLAKDSDLRKVTFKDVAGLDEEKEELE